jgi:membrane protein required for beta-lactamase induction
MLLIFVFGFRAGNYDILFWITLLGCIALLGFTWLPWQRWTKKGK